jgi:hypothetical protein
MKLLQDLGLLEYGSKGKRMTYGIYECPICYKGFKCATSRIKKGVIAQCRTCADNSKIQKSRKEFSIKASKIHNNKYDYSLVNYTDASTKVQIVCGIHGVFEQTPHNHLKGTTCPECAKEQTSLILSLQAKIEFNERATIIHNGLYDYSLVEYVNNWTKVKITCPIHGTFHQRPTNHLQGCGCPSCAVTGFDINKPAYLYYLKITTDANQVLYKIGITNRTVEARFNLNDLSKIEIVKQKLYDIGQDAYDWEQKLLKMYKQYQYKGPDILSSGNTELFTKDVIAIYYADN